MSKRTLAAIENNSHWIKHYEQLVKQQEKRKKNTTMKLHAPEIQTLIELCRERISANTKEQSKAAEAGQWDKAKDLQSRSEWIDSIRAALQSELDKQLKIK